MRELQDILEAWRVLAQCEERAALATVVQVEGSAYRREGARMLIAQNGRTWGGISGGCLEADAVLRAQQVMERNQAETVCYDTRGDADIFFGLGLGCNGVIRVLIEPLEAPLHQAQMEFYRAFLACRNPVALATIFHSTSPRAPLGARVLLRDDAFLNTGIAHEKLQRAMERDARAALKNRQSQNQNYEIEGASIEAFVEVLEPPLSLVIFGVGHDVLPVVQMAKTLGWRVTVADHRAACATVESFPDADRVLAGSAGAIWKQIEIDARTGVVLMSHDFLHDRELLPLLFNSPALYIGLLGSQRRTERLLSDLAQDGEYSRKDARLHAPVGLDIGAQTPQEIALAIVAQMQAVFAGKSGGFLSDLSDGSTRARNA